MVIEGASLGETPELFIFLLAAAADGRNLLPLDARGDDSCAKNRKEFVKPGDQKGRNSLAKK
jgi:hypothetical protein